MAMSTLGSYSTTVAPWVALSGVRMSTCDDPATTCALVTMYFAATGHDEPASAPPQPVAMTSLGTPAALRIPGVSTSGGICAGASVLGTREEKGLGKPLPRRMFWMVARNPGGRGTKLARARSLRELLIW